METKDEELLLETVRSRCTIKYVSPESVGVKETLPEFNNISEKLNLAKEKSSKRDEAEIYIDQLLIASKENLDPTRVRALFKAKKYLKANCNTRLVMENLFLNW